MLSIHVPQSVGVMQLPSTITDKELAELHQVGIRTLRFHLKRSGREQLRHLGIIAKQAYERVGRHDNS